MKTAIVYTSQTGFTEQYAKWIADETGGDLIELSAAKHADFSPYDAVVFGGWARAGQITGVRWLKDNLPKWGDKKVAVFCTGASPETPETLPALLKTFSALEQAHIRIFYCPGGLRYESMPLASRAAMKLFSKAVAAKKNKTEDEALMARLIASSYDISDRAYIRPIVTFLTEPG